MVKCDVCGFESCSDNVFEVHRDVFHGDSFDVVVSKGVDDLRGVEGAKTGLYAVHSLYPRTGNPKQSGTGHLSKEANDAYCLDTGNMQGVEFENKRIRRLTPVECERLQGFPDNWTEGLSDTQRYKCLGNAVTTNVIKVIIERLLECC